MRNPIDLSKEAFDILFGNIKLFVGIALVPMVLSFIGVLLGPTPAEQMVGIEASPAYIVMMVLSIVANIFMGIALALVMQNRSLSVTEAYKQSTPFFWNYVIMSIIMSVLLLIGFLLFVVPFVILMVWFAFSTFVLVLERSGAVDALKKSREYVRGHWWPVFGRLVALILIILVLNIALSMVLAMIPAFALSKAITAALSLLFAPFAVAYMYLLYQDLKGGTAPAPAPAETPATPTV